MPTTAKISVGQAEDSDKYSRGGRSRNRKALRVRKQGVLIQKGLSRAAKIGRVERISRANNQVALQHTTRIGRNYAMPIITHDQRGKIELSGSLPIIVKPMTRRDSFFPNQIVHSSSPDTVRDIQDWLQTQRETPSSEKFGDSELERQEVGPSEPKIEPQDDIETVLHKLENGLLDNVARRIRYLELEIDEEEGEEPINLNSLHGFAQFMLENRSIGSPSTWIDHRGFLGLEWRIPYLESIGNPADVGAEHWGRGDGILAMVFLPNGLIRFSATSGPVTRDMERLNVSGTYTPSATMEAVQPFLSRLETR